MRFGSDRVKIFRLTCASIQSAAFVIALTNVSTSSERPSEETKMPTFSPHLCIVGRRQIAADHKFAAMKETCAFFHEKSELFNVSRI